MRWLAVLLCVSPAFAVGPQVEEEPFGKMPDGKPVTKYTLTNRRGAKVAIITYGGIVTNLWVPDMAGRLTDVVLGFDTLDGYLAGHPYFGANVGRCGNRIANAKFELDGKSYTITTGNPPHTLHGGKVGFDKKLWRGEPMMTVAGPAVRLTYTSPDGEEGYPGNLSVAIQYTWTSDNALRIEMSATTDKITVCNIAHHSYFNLDGHNAGPVFDHMMQIMAKNYTPGDKTLIPTGKIEPVAGTPFDFTKPKLIIVDMKKIDADPQGYDLNYVLDGDSGEMPRLAAKVKGGLMGMEVYTDQPGLQFYTGNFLGKEVGKGGAKYMKHGAFCLEAQKFPDAINKPEWRIGAKSPILMPRDEYRQTTVYRFTAK
jgi:aldose 1-epimerase